MKSYLDLLKLLPKSNCGECGFQSCLLFALKVFNNEVSPEKCPYLPLENIPQEFSGKGLTFNQHLDNLNLREIFRNLNDFPERARNLGCFINSEQRIVQLPYLDLKIQIFYEERGNPQALKTLSGELPDPRDEILICNYFIFNGKIPLSGQFVGLETFSHCTSKLKTLSRYAEEPLAEILSDHSLNIEKGLSAFEVNEFTQSSSGISFLIKVLPKIFLKVHFWYGEEEENLPPSCKILYDREALSYLDLECLVFCAERFVERLREKFI